MVAGLLQMVVSQNIEWTIVWPVTNMRARKSTFTNIQRELLSKWARTRKRTAMSKWNNNNIHHIHEGNGTAAVSLSLFDQHYEWKSYFFSHLFSKMFQKIDDCSNPLSKCTQTENSMRFSKNLNKISSFKVPLSVRVCVIDFLFDRFIFAVLLLFQDFYHIGHSICDIECLQHKSTLSPVQPQLNQNLLWYARGRLSFVDTTTYCVVNSFSFFKLVNSNQGLCTHGNIRRNQ